MTEAKKTVDAAVPVKNTAEQKAAAPKKAAEKKVAAPKKAAEKKSTAPKDVKVDVIVEHHGRQINSDAIVKNAEKLWVLAGHDAAKIAKVELYVKQEDGAVYCVVNGEAVGKYDL